MSDIPEDNSVQSLVRGLNVIRTFGAERPRQKLSQVAKNAGLPRASARRFLHTLVLEGFAATDGTEFWLTPKILELGYSFMSGFSLPSIAQPYLEALSHKTHESSSMSVLNGTDIVYVSRVPVRKIMQVNITIGTRFPAYATAMGRVLLADLDEATLNSIMKQIRWDNITGNTIDNEAELRTLLRAIRLHGYCLVDEELELGLRSVAAPIIDATGRTVAAVNVSTPTASHTTSELHAVIVPALLETTEAISCELAATDLT